MIFPLMADIIGSSWIMNPVYAITVTVVIALLIGFIIGRIGGRLLFRILHAIELNKISRKAGFHYKMEELLSETVTAVIYISTVFYALGRLGISTWVVYIIASILLLTIILASILNIGSIIPDILAARYARRFAAIGDNIEGENFKGRVSARKLTHLKLAGLDDEELIIANSLFKEGHKAGRIVCRKKSKQDK
jgi:small-conductance mechanosensitive channel